MKKAGAEMSCQLQPIAVTRPTSGRHTALLIFLHGSGDSGEGIKSSVDMMSGRGGFSFAHIKIIYPTAPVRPYTLMGGFSSHVWFDRYEMSPQGQEDLTSMDEMCRGLDEIVKHEINQGVSADRIVIGGNSMGGCMALHYTYRWSTSFPACFVLSGFLATQSVVYKKLKQNGADIKLASLYQTHGSLDDLVPIDWARDTHESLKKCNVIGQQFHAYPDLGHELSSDLLLKLRDWIMTVLPERDSFT